jgi:serine/threonine-protein kinase
VRRELKHYEIVRRLGAGAHGVAYYAYDTVLLRPVVLKIVRGEAGIASTLREARLASAIDHANVCSVYEVGEADGDSYIAMQFVPGRPLSRWLEGGPLELDAALSIGAQISDGLASAHALGIIHRDLKPANIMVTEGGHAKILDFGLARRRPRSEVGIETGTGSGSRAGTIGYMAPELFAGGRASERSDIFALGILLYMMVTGKYPFVGIDQADIARAIRTRDPIPASEERAGLPQGIEAAIERAMAKEPDERFASAAELRDLLRTALGALGAASAPEDAGLPVSAPRAAGAATTATATARRLLTSLAPWKRESRPTAAIAVLSFANRGQEPVPPFYGHALASAIATRLSTQLVVRAPTSLLAGGRQLDDPVAIGRDLAVEHVLTGSFSRRGSRFEVEWQLIEVETSVVATGGAVSLDSLDLVAIQTEIGDGVFARIGGSRAASPARAVELDDAGAEIYLEARALLASAMLRSRRRSDLDRAGSLFARVLESSPELARAHAGLGVVQLQRARNGFAGAEALEAAQASLERASELDPGLLEARLFGVFTAMARGEKESARYAVQDLLDHPERGFDVHLVAAIVLRTDGEYDRAANQLGAALAANPAAAHVTYYHRSRLRLYRGDLDEAWRDVERARVLAPEHLLIRISRAYLTLRRGDPATAAAELEAIIAEEPHLHVAVPTLALCRLALGEAGATAVIGADTLAAAAADGETAYRVATAYAAAADLEPALTWLRKAIYLGNENYPWFASNPLWGPVAEEPDLIGILSRLRGRHARNLDLWKRLLGQVRRR